MNSEEQTLTSSLNLSEPSQKDSFGDMPKPEIYRVVGMSLIESSLDSLPKPLLILTSSHILISHQLEITWMDLEKLNNLVSESI